jgi:hypothetical protein
MGAADEEPGCALVGALLRGISTGVSTGDIQEALGALLDNLRHELSREPPKDLVPPHSGFYTGGKPLKDRGGSGVNAAC